MQIVRRCRLTSARGWLRILARETEMKAKMSVTVVLGKVSLAVGDDEGALTVDEAKRLASLLEDVARAIESAKDVGDSDD